MFNIQYRKHLLTTMTFKQEVIIIAFYVKNVAFMAKKILKKIHQNVIINAFKVYSLPEEF